MSHPIHLDCLTHLHRLIFLIRLPHTLNFLAASLWVGLSTILGYNFSAFIFNPACTHHCTALFFLRAVTQVICLIWYAVNRTRCKDQILCTHLRQCPAETLKSKSSGPDHTVFLFLAKWIKNDTRYLNRQNLTPETDGLDYIWISFSLSHTPATCPLGLS